MMLVALVLFTMLTCNGDTQTRELQVTLRPTRLDSDCPFWSRVGFGNPLVKHVMFEVIYQTQVQVFHQMDESGYPMKL